MKQYSKRSSAYALRAAICALMVAAFAPIAFQPAKADQGYDNAVQNAVKWTSVGTNENDSMPIGNGDLAANVWTEQNGDLLLLLAKADSWDEAGEMLKLGRVRLHFDKTPFSSNFSQTLNAADGSIVIKDGATSIRIWIDANNPAIHTEVHLAAPQRVGVRLEIWRNGSGKSSDKKGDTVLPSSPGRLTWYHRNETSEYASLMTHEHLEDLLTKYNDPWLHRTFGATVLAQGLKVADDHNLIADKVKQDYRIDIVALSQENAASGDDWLRTLDNLVVTANPADLKQSWTAHQQWWREFWDRSWIKVTGDKAAEAVTQGYLMQRYMMAASSRGLYPVKHNGGLFTVGHDRPQGKSPTADDHDPDYRRWGSNYWNQNARLLYWPLVTTGDYDLLQPWFNMYTNALPMAKDRTQIYFRHEGAMLPETMFYFGIPRLHDFGRNNPTYVMASTWQRYHTQGTLEVILEMLDYYQYTGDAKFAEESLLPFADAIATFYDVHWPRDSKGKILMSPSQSLETYQLNAINPTPDIAGLKAVLPRLLALPQSMTNEGQRKRWTDMLADLPPIPVGTTGPNGKTPPFGAGVATGKKIILPAERYGKTGNGENPELYVAFPYRLYGVGKPDLQLAQDTFAARLFPQDNCWGQDGTQAAVLGLTGDAQKVVTAEFSNYGEQRFKWFWKAEHDWIPDLDNGGSGMITLQLMLLQSDDKRIQLTPAWPKNWTADFKLKAPYNTTVSGHVENGKLTKLEVFPKERQNDVVVVPVN